MNDVLLDTNALIWLFEGSARMDSARKLFSLPNTRVYISVVSWWEMTIKMRTGKFSINIEQLESYINQYDFIELPITREYLKAYRKLPPLHKDPFDLMLVAQAITGPMRLITGDSQLAQYSSLVMVV